jgi:hypothetical protein
MRVSLGVEQGRTPPVEIADAVETWARQYGRHATLRFVPHMQPPCWSVNLTLKPDDPALRRWQEGAASELPTEGVLLLEWDAGAGEIQPATGEPAGAYRAVSLEEYGADGVVALLERGNTWSGRGEFASMQEAVTAAASRSREEKNRRRAQMRQWARDLAADQRRQILQIPLVPVGIALGTRVENDGA